MLTVYKKDGAVSTAGDVVKKGSKGRLELVSERNEDGSYSLVFKDYGNYGRVRWEADFGVLTREDLNTVIDELVALRDGVVESTSVVEPEVVVRANAEEDVEVTALQEESVVNNSQVRA